MQSASYSICNFGLSNIIPDQIVIGSACCHFVVIMLIVRHNDLKMTASKFHGQIKRSRLSR